MCARKSKSFSEPLFSPHKIFIIFSLTENDEEIEFTTCDSLGQFLINRVTVHSKGKEVCDVNNFGYLSYINTLCKLPETYRNKVLRQQILFMEEGESAEGPLVITTSKCGDARAGFLNNGRKPELLIPLMIPAFVTNRLIPTASDINITIQIAGLSQQ